MLDGSSRFVDRQVTWTSDFVSGVQDKVIDDDYKEESDTESTSALSLIPQYIGYTKRENEPIKEIKSLGIDWLNNHPEIVRELRLRGGLD